jgi:hypothetical protein
MIRNFPLRTDDEPINKVYLDGQLTGMRAEMAGMRAEQRADLRVEFNRALVWIVTTIVATAGASLVVASQLFD